MLQESSHSTDHLAITFHPTILVYQEPEHPTPKPEQT